MPRKTWHFQLADGSHTVTLEHGSISGKRVIQLDDQVIERSSKLIDFGSTHTFDVNGHRCTVRIRTNGITPQYAFEVAAGPNGEHLTAGPSVPEAGHETMRREIRSWGRWLLFWGVIQLVGGVVGGSLFSGTWAVVLISIGLASFVFRTPANFVLYATVLFWAGLTNAVAGGAGGLVIAVVQLVLSVWCFASSIGIESGSEITQ